MLTQGRRKPPLLSGERGFSFAAGPDAPQSGPVLCIAGCPLRLYEMKYTSVAHFMYEAGAISYLLGRGYDFTAARRIVESWEVQETFPPYQTY